MTVIKFKPRLPRDLINIEMQRDVVRAAYAKTNSLNPDYEREFDKLSSMVNEYQAKCFRASLGLPDNAKTPYDNFLGGRHETAI